MQGFGEGAAAGDAAAPCIGYEIVQNLDVLVPQTVEQLPNIVQFFAAHLLVVVEPVIEVPKILPHDVPPRRLCRDTQLAEQLVEVPTIVSYSLLQLIMEQNADSPVPLGRGGRHAGLQGSPPEQSSTAALSSAERISERIVEQNVDMTVGGGLQDFRPGHSSSSVARSPAEWLTTEDEAIQGVFFALFPKQKNATVPPLSGSTLPPHSSPWTPAAHDASMVLEEEEEEERRRRSQRTSPPSTCSTMGVGGCASGSQLASGIAADGSQVGHTIWRPPWLIGSGPW